MSDMMSKVYPSNPLNPHLRRWMIFVDGENVTLRGQEFAKKRGIDLVEGDHYHRDVFLWLRTEDWATVALHHPLRAIGLQGAATRAFYYTSVRGDADQVTKIHEQLWTLGFTAHVFKKAKQSGRTLAFCSGRCLRVRAL